MKFHSGNIIIPAPVRRDLTIIRKRVEKELKIPVRSKCRKLEYVDAKKVFICLVLYVYNAMQKEIGNSHSISMAVLAKYLRYTSHSSISLMLVNTNKGNLTLLDYIKSSPKLEKCYYKIKMEIGVDRGLPFRQFLTNKKAELEQEIAVINRYLKIHTPNEEVQN